MNYLQESAREKNSFTQILSQNLVLYQSKSKLPKKRGSMTNVVVICSFRTQKSIKSNFLFLYCLRKADFFSNFELFFLYFLEKGGNGKFKKRFVDSFSDCHIFHSSIYIYHNSYSLSLFGADTWKVFQK